MRRRLLFIAAIATCLGLAACGEQPAANSADDPLVGTWQALDQDGVYIFRADGSGELRTGSSSELYTWKTEDENILILIHNPAGPRGRELIHAFTPEGQLEIWTADNPGKTRFERQ